MRSALVGLLSLLAASAARGHALDVAYLEIEAEGARVRASLDLSIEVAGQLAQAGPLSTAAEVQAKGAALARATLGSGEVQSSGAPCSLGNPQASLEGSRVRLALQASCPNEVTDLRWTFPFVDGASLDYRVLVKSVIGGAERNYILEPGASTLRVQGEGRRGFLDFVSMGFHHIGASPAEWRDNTGLHLPAGVDHILFLLALILAGGTVLKTIGTVTGFTAGHSITLGLASFGVVSLPSRLTESAIALSIVYVAVEDLIVSEPRHRWRIATVFGLVHGFGFASALTELHLSRGGLFGALLGFNLGVELGQALIVALLAPLVLLLRRREWFRRIGSRACALGIAAAGSFWFVQRAFF